MKSPRRVLLLLAGLVALGVMLKQPLAAQSADAPSPPATDPVPPPLPAADAFVTVLSNDIVSDADRTPVNPGLDLLSVYPQLYVTTTAKSDLTFTYGLRVLVENVPGMAKGTVILGSNTDGLLRPDHKTEQFNLGYPEGGLPPGTYRLEIYLNTDPDKVVQTTSFKTQYVALPASDALELVVRAGAIGHDRDEAVAPGTEFSSWPDKLFIELTEKQDLTLDFTARVLTDKVPGLPDNLVMSSTARADQALTPEHKLSFAELDFARVGLPPGRYRVEVTEGPEPHRLVRTMTFTTQDRELTAPEFNLADSELGGLLESVTGEDGAGQSWASLLLVRGNTERWSPLGAPTLDGPGSQPAGALPCDLVVSFFQREAALVSAVELVSSSTDCNHPHEVEVWGSTQSATEGFTKLGAGTFEHDDNQLAQRITFAPTSVRFLKIRLVSKQDPSADVELVGLRVIEGSATGYQPLAQRQSALANWRFQPRHAAQRGLYFLQPTATQWQQTGNCLGCHVQSQSLVGINIARKNDYVISGTVEKFLAGFTFGLQGTAGNVARITKDVPELAPDAESANTIYAALGMAYAPHDGPAARAQLVRVAHWLVKLQAEEGSLTGDDGRVPIEQGDIMFTANCLEVWNEALKLQDDPVLKTAAARGLAYVAGAETVTTQDQTFKIMTLARYGDAAQKHLARDLSTKLQHDQQEDGGWKVEPDDKLGSAAFSTGQALYAFRLAGINPNSKSFQRGVQFLILKQKPNGSWKDPQLSSPFAATMWPVIALAGSFGSQIEPAHLVMSAKARPHTAASRVPTVTAPPPVVVATAPVAAVKPLPNNIEFILDCSFSMYDRLGKSTRLETARQVMRDLIAHLPADAKVGLRLYGHRYDSMTGASATDTQLMVPISPINRPLLLKVINEASAHGQTPLVYSTLKAADDLKLVGGGTIIVVTDGEESCGGKPRKAGVQLAALGVPLRLDIIGFTLTGKRVVDDLTAFTGATGGRYYTAADGAALSKALADAIAPAPQLVAPTVVAPVVQATPEPETVPENYAYEVFDGKGVKVVASSTLGGEAAVLPAGVYRVVLHDGTKEVVFPELKIATSDDVSLRYDPAAGQIEIQK